MASDTKVFSQLKHARDLYLVHDGREVIVFDNEGVSKTLKAADVAAQAPAARFEFQWLFGRQQVGRSPTYEASLINLGRAMTRKPPDDLGYGNDPGTIPAGYTYFGQFLAHEITFLQTGSASAVRSARSPQIDLDSLFDPVAVPAAIVPGNPPSLRVGSTEAGSELPSFPNDLPRGPDGTAIVVETRNDELLPVAQMHLLFLRFCNAVIAHPGVNSKDDVKKIVLQHFQSVVLHDYLPRIIDTAVYQDVMTNGRVKFMPPGTTQAGLRLPLEFAVAAYRFGHSMARGDYRWNARQPLADFAQFWQFTHAGRRPDLPPMLKLPSDWVINWLNFFDFTGTALAAAAPETLMANLIDTRLGQELGRLPMHLVDVTAMPNDLPVRTLLRGHRLDLADVQTAIADLNALLPTGQQIVPLTAAELKVDENLEIAAALDANGGEFLGSTPLFFYVLKEAKLRAAGKRLGPLGSRLVMEVLHGILERSPHSILNVPNWQPLLAHANPSKFTMPDLIAFTGGANPVG